MHEKVPGDYRLVTYLLLESGVETLDVPALRSYLKETLPDYMIPVHFIVMDKFPVSPNGKLNRLALPEPDYSDKEPTSIYAAPRNEQEQEIFDLFAAALHLGQIGIFDSFF